MEIECEDWIWVDMDAWMTNHPLKHGYYVNHNNMTFVWLKKHYH